MIRHFIWALALSYGLSILFWALFDVFVLVPFLLVSAGCAALGVLIGWTAKKTLWVTILATLVIRCGVFLVVSNPF